MSDTAGQRGQTEGIAVILLTAILILGIGTFGVFYLSSLSETSGTVAADIDVTAVNASGSATLTVTHAGGETIDDGVVVLRSRGEQYRLPPTFEEGMQNRTALSDAPSGSTLQVLVVENASNSVVFESRVTVRSA